MNTEYKCKHNKCWYTPFDGEIIFTLFTVKIRYFICLFKRLTLFITECDEYYTEMTGSFNSPGYPSQYPNKADCHHYITVAAGYTINLIVKDFRSESCCDYLKVCVLINDY